MHSVYDRPTALTVVGSLFKEASMTASRQTIRLHAVDFKQLHSRRRLRVGWAGHFGCGATLSFAIM